ncbi:hypothetical protein HMPREF0326_02888 [Desulfovibrio sp. 3_1_syn3]|uniref:glycosyltransferase family 2 protein n=1 Tax=Desulfovibrio sp. 3_1_syn3 TaxID=457398 RepID=UPI0001E12C5B|nr:glycosyltransferase family 2 protein [Desulfovibrio sp. 3_1_syn3]EFL84529.1 hypothetical protein HMPREF0326_02888 [Desulfovibrio sp. 3_1_syn3]
MDWAVSVIVPFYNAAPWLERCLKSLLAQYLRELEIILVDDASTDASPKIAERYTGRYPDRIRYLRQESNMGPGAARNVGLSLARGEYVGFVDADDMAEPEMFSSLYATARKTGAQVAVCGIYLSRDGREHEILPGYICDAQNLFKNVRLFPSPCNKIFQRNYLIMIEANFPLSRMSEDMAFVFKIIVNSPRIVYINRPLYRYLTHSSSASFDILKRKKAFISIIDVKKYLKKYNKFDKYKYKYKKMYFLHLIYYPICLVVIDALIKGNNRWRILWQSPSYFYSLLKFLFRRSI